MCHQNEVVNKNKGRHLGNRKPHKRLRRSSMATVKGGLRRLLANISV
jgi:hypothetical protein